MDKKKIKKQLDDYHKAIFKARVKYNDTSDAEELVKCNDALNQFMDNTFRFSAFINKSEVIETDNILEYCSPYEYHTFKSYYFTDLFEFLGSIKNLQLEPFTIDSDWDDEIAFVSSYSEFYHEVEAIVKLFLKYRNQIMADKKIQNLISSMQMVNINLAKEILKTRV